MTFHRYGHFGFSSRTGWFKNPKPKPTIKKASFSKQAKIPDPEKKKEWKKDVEKQEGI